MPNLSPTNRPIPSLTNQRRRLAKLMATPLENLNDNQLLERLQSNDAQIEEVQNLIKTLENRLETLINQNHALKQHMRSKVDDI